MTECSRDGRLNISEECLSFWDLIHTIPVAQVGCCDVNSSLCSHQAIEETSNISRASVFAPFVCLCRAGCLSIGLYRLETINIRFLFISFFPSFIRQLRFLINAQDEDNFQRHRYFIGWGCYCSCSILFGYTSNDLIGTFYMASPRCFVLDAWTISAPLHKKTVGVTYRTGFRPKLNPDYSRHVAWSRSFIVLYLSYRRSNYGHIQVRFDTNSFY